MPELERGDVVKLGRTAQELHDVLHLVSTEGVRIRQRSTGKERTVYRGRCIVVKHGSNERESRA